jgi:hypothetical protein
MRFRRKVTEIEAVQFKDTPGHDPAGVSRNPQGAAYVTTIHRQPCFLEKGDWIVPEPDGQHYYPVKPDIFAATYEPVRDFVPGRKDLAKDLVFELQQVVAAAMEAQHDMSLVLYRLAPDSSSVLNAVWQERLHQIADGYDPDHDDGHPEQELMMLAMLLLCHQTGHQLAGIEPPSADSNAWPDLQFLKLLKKYEPYGRHLMLVAIALLVAEVERLDRDYARKVLRCEI